MGYAVAGYMIAAMAVTLATAGARADDLDDCSSQQPERRITGCTAVIDAPDTPPDTRAEAFFRRGVSYSEFGQYKRAIHDYDETIRIAPAFAAALNNRAYSYLKLGQPSVGVPDIEQAMQLQPENPIFLSTRGEIAQVLGDREGAMRDHEAAMAFGGKNFVKVYQCSLRLAGLYRGPIDGIIHAEVRTALRQCVDLGSGCAPVPAFPVPECPEPVG
jgi:tetratricopeptide (TPR) repeat protein